MKEFKGTQGKWEVVAGDDNAPDVISDIGVEIAFTPTYNGDKAEQLCNAKLIASSPELLEALQKMLSKAYKQNWNDAYPEVIKSAQNAINKALGE